MSAEPRDGDPATSTETSRDAVRGPVSPSPERPPRAAKASPVTSHRTDSTIRMLDNRLAEIEGLDVSALRAAWASLFGRSPPKSVSRRLLEHAAAYGAQAKVHGNLKSAIRRKLLQAAQSQPDSMDGTLRRKRREVLSPGSRLVRQWHGRSHTVEVTDGGFLYAGKRYRSLSQVARAITGARWSGPRFFGL
jgi:hypothetical protein